MITTSTNVIKADFMRVKLNSSPKKAIMASQTATADVKAAI